ncbi:MAG: cupin domain-containing protein [Chloroflexi bacterium]|nr:cupin domain-containing protein [Chloroflexota bacterium]
MNSDYTFVADLAGQLPDIPPDTIVSRTFYADEHFKAIVFGFAAGQELSEHTASQPAILHFVKGKADLTLGGDSREAVEGTWVRMPAGLKHSVVARTPVVMLLLLLKASESA